MEQIVEDIQEELQMGPMFYIYNRSNNYCLKKCLWYIKNKFLAGITIKNCHLLVVNTGEFK